MCEHMNFDSAIRIGRIQKVEDGPIVGYCADISIKCSDCGEPLQFIGLPIGSSQYTSMTNVDGTELRAALKALNGPMPPDGLPGYTVRLPVEGASS